MCILITKNLKKKVVNTSYILRQSKNRSVIVYLNNQEFEENIYHWHHFFKTIDTWGNKGEARISWKFLTLITSHWHPRYMTSYRKINIVSEIFYIIVISNSHPSWRKTEILVMLFSFCKKRTRSCQSFFLQKNCV